MSRDPRNLAGCGATSASVLHESGLRPAAPRGDAEGAARERVRATLAALPRPSAETAKAYTEAIDELVSRVNRSLSGHPELEVLIGENPPCVMFDNQSAHAHFIAAVMQRGHFELLPATLPWVYRGCIGQGFTSRYFLEEISAWRRAISDVLDESSATSILPLYNWIDQHHEDWLVLSSPPSTSPLVEEDCLKTERLRCYEALRGGELRPVLELASAASAELGQVRQFCEGVITPALAQIGLDWERGELTVAEEHRATCIVQRALAALQLAAPRAVQSPGHAIVTAAPNEHHSIGATMLAMLLERDGWSVSYLGADTPEEDLVTLVRYEKPSFLAMSVSVVYNLGGVAQVASALRGHGSSRRVKIMVGGHALRTLPDAAAVLGVDAAPRSFDQALDTARQWSDF